VGSAKWALPALLLGAVGIAFGPLFVRLAEVGPTTSAFYRMALSLPLLLIWLSLENGPARHPPPPKTGREKGTLILAGLFFTIDLAIWHWSITLTSVANSTLFANAAPIFVTLGGFVLFGQRFRPLFLVGLVVAILGAVLLMGDSVTIGGTHLLGDGLAVLAAVFYAAYMMTLSRLRARFSTATIMSWSGAVSSLGLLLLALLGGERLVPETAAGWAALMGLALMAQLGGQSLIAYAFAHLPAAFGAVALLLQPALAGALAWAFLGEPLTFQSMSGGAIILLGILLARKGSR